MYNANTLNIYKILKQQDHDRNNNDDLVIISKMIFSDTTQYNRNPSIVFVKIFSKLVSFNVKDFS